ncbi:Trypsin- protease [Beauveria brongniartii RCEF 3172]|uniref:Trypsin-protease n=1 Tax=Beauveria brongniartii RCEF 3172 TaxID=1081107 RepID=A0A166VWJ4_9HYPO|nr:Trypsin- protease [Beauveria brongniartii RCEF 3172]
MALKAAVTLAISLSSTLSSATPLDKRIVNGQDAKEGEIKFIVSIRDKNGVHNCGGSLLDSTTVLTAAHCVHYGKLVSVTAGTLKSKPGLGVEAQIASFTKHPNYSPTFEPGGPFDKLNSEELAKLHWEDNDIAIVKLSTPIEKSNTIEFATLPPAGSDAVVDSKATAAGWGRQAPRAKDDSQATVPAETLSKVVLPIHAREECAKYDGVGSRETIICAGGKGKNVCNADSGGPLFDEKSGQVLGLTSITIEDTEGESDGETCNQTPGLFTRVSSYIDFINEHLGSAPNTTAV